MGKDRVLHSLYFRICTKRNHTERVRAGTEKTSYRFLIFAVKSFNLMAEIENTIKQEQQGMEQNAQPSQETPMNPNRDKYAAMWKEDNPDVDFENKEARYERMGKDREELRNLRSSGRKLSGILDKHRWVGAMRMDDEENPLVWMAKNGIDIKAALDDPEVMQKVTDAFDGWTKKQADGEAAEKAKDDAIAQSLEDLNALRQEVGLSDEQCNRLWEHFWDNVFAPAFQGVVTKDTWTALLHAMNYDTDMANAREEAAIQARNEKHTNKLKTFDEQQVPPSFSQGQGQVTSNKPKKEESIADFIRRNG